MASVKFMAAIICLFGICSFLAGITAERNKPASGIPIKKKGVIMCKYQDSDPALLWGGVAIACLLVSTLFGWISLILPYKGKSVPKRYMHQNAYFHTFYYVTLFTTTLAAALLISPTVTEYLHIRNNIHHNLKTECPTAKTGVLGGGAYMSLNASLFWLISLMLACNAREDYLDEVEKDEKSEYGPITETAAA